MLPKQRPERRALEAGVDNDCWRYTWDDRKYLAKISSQKQCLPSEWPAVLGDVLEAPVDGVRSMRWDHGGFVHHDQIEISQQCCLLGSGRDIAGAVLEDWNWQLEEAVHCPSLHHEGGCYSRPRCTRHLLASYPGSRGAGPGYEASHLHALVSEMGSELVEDVGLP